VLRGADKGATSVVFAVVAVLLFAIAALAVDIGNLFARSQAVRSVADAAAFAAAQELPDTCAVRQAALSALAAEDNLVRDDAAPETATVVTGTDLIDRDLSNGEVEVLGADLGVLTGCSMQGRSVRVTTPQRQVRFAFAPVLDVFVEGGGRGLGVVSASARVAVAGAVVDTLPFYLPGGCPGASKTGRHHVATTDEPPPPTPTAEPSEEPTAPPSGSPSPTPTLTPSPTPPRPACPEDPDQEFGVLGSPRADLTGTGAVLAANVRDGLDHTVAALAGAGPGTACADGTPAGARRDVVGGPAGDGANCVLVQAPGATTTGGALQDGLLGADGRLVVTAPPSLPPGCRPAGGVPGWTTPTGARAWNSVPSCYLADGATLSDVLRGAPGSLDEQVLADPRFFLLPELHEDSRPEPGRYHPVRALWGAFLTDEGTDGTAGCGSDACNGISVDVTGVRSLEAFVFPLTALPPFVQEPTNGAAFRDGLPRTLVLVE